jgi:mannose-6-phosphate isomerase-like protein (cupin superfamily)
MNFRTVTEQETHPTIDGSDIRRLFNKHNSPTEALSLAEASLQPYTKALLHHHKQATEIYFVLSGSGEVEVEGELRSVKVGDAVLILPGQSHRMTALGQGIRFLCCCAPPFSVDDTVLDEPIAQLCKQT